jgi:hypothetical protein
LNFRGLHAPAAGDHPWFGRLPGRAPTSPGTRCRGPEGDPQENQGVLQLVNGREFFNNETTTKGPFLVQGKPSTIVISIRKASLSLSIDGRPIFGWKGDPGRIAEQAGLRVPNKDAMVLGCYDTKFLVSQITLTPVSGQGRKLR